MELKNNILQLQIYHPQSIGAGYMMSLGYIYPRPTLNVH